MDERLKIGPATAPLLEIMANLAADHSETNTRIFHFTKENCYMKFNSTVPIHGNGDSDYQKDLHWHKAVEHGVLFHPGGGVVGAVTIDHRINPIENGQHFIITAETIHSVVAREGAVLIAWHDGLAMPFPRETLPKNITA